MDHSSSHSGTAMADDDGLFAPLADNGVSGRVVFSTQDHSDASPEHQQGSGLSKWSRIDVWQQKPTNF